MLALCLHSQRKGGTKMQTLHVSHQQQTQRARVNHHIFLQASTLFTWTEVKLVPACNPTQINPRPTPVLVLTVIWGKWHLSLCGTAVEPGVFKNKRKQLSMDLICINCRAFTKVTSNLSSSLNTVTISI